MMIRLAEKLEGLLHRFVQWRRGPGNLVLHAKRELEIAKVSEAGYDGMLTDAVLELVELFGRQGHSGMSASMTTSLVEKLMRFEPLTPLTGADDEWNDVSENSSKERGTVFKNRRCSHVFKDDNGPYDINGRVFREPDGSCYTGSGSNVPVVFPYVPKVEYVDVGIGERHEQIP